MTLKGMKPFKNLQMVTAEMVQPVIEMHGNPQTWVSKAPLEQPDDAFDLTAALSTVG